MKNVWVICQKELKGYFASPIAYFLLTMFAALFGFFFWTAVRYFVVVSGRQMGGGMPMNINEYIIRPLLANVSVIGLFLIPMITMRLFAEEKRSGTIELLLTSPVTDFQILFGKWLAALLMYTALLLVCGLNFVWLFVHGQPDWRPMLVGLVGLVLQAGGLLAIGTFLSTLTRNQIIAGGATFGVCLLLWVTNWVTEFESADWARVISYLSIVGHFESFAKGVIDTKDVVFYLSVIFVGLFLTARSLESLRWRA
jgi:ABC-2 type transport system permease protein